MPSYPREYDGPEALQDKGSKATVEIPMGIMRTCTETRRSTTKIHKPRITTPETNDPMS